MMGIKESYMEGVGSLKNQASPNLSTKASLSKSDVNFTCGGLSVNFSIDVSTSSNLVFIYITIISC